MFTCTMRTMTNFFLFKLLAYQFGGAFHHAKGLSFDSVRDSSVPRLIPRTAFQDPKAQEGTPPWGSIEMCRCVNPTARIMTDTVNVFMTRMQGIWMLSTVAALHGSRNPSESAVQSAAASFSFKGTPSRGTAHVATRGTSDGISSLASNVFCLAVLFSQVNYRVHWSFSRINAHVRDM